VLVKYKRIELYAKRGLNWEVVRKVMYKEITLHFALIDLNCRHLLVMSSISRTYYGPQQPLVNQQYRACSSIRSILIDSFVNRVVICFGLQDQQKIVGLAFADTSLQTMGVSEFPDNVHLSNLEVLLSSPSHLSLSSSLPLTLSPLSSSLTFMAMKAMLIQVGAKECLLTDSARDEVEVKKVTSLLEKCNIMRTVVKPGTPLFDLQQHVVETANNNTHT